MIRKMMTALTLAVPAMPSAAQEIVPIISPGQAAEGLFQRSRMEAEARRQREADARDAQATETEGSARPAPGSPEARKQVCDNRPLYRKQYGADHPKIVKLEELCKEAGY